MKERIKVYLYNKTMKEIDMSDFSYISEDVFSERTDIVKVVLPEGVKEIGNNAFENCILLKKWFVQSRFKRLFRSFHRLYQSQKN